ncbi:MAG: hypothetical protein ABWY25_03210 [Paenisporosarcina sp.]
MIFDFRFWRYFSRQQELIDNLANAQMRDFKTRVWMVGLLGLLLFAIRELWGMNTENLTSIFVVAGSDAYTIARMVSLLGILVWAFIYMAFHFFGIAFLLNKLTHIDLSKLAVLQLYVVAILLLEKALLYVIFILLGFTTPVSLFSFGPLAGTFLEQPFFIFFFNQLSIFTALIIALQIRFIRAFSDYKSSHIFLLVIAMHILMALITSAVGFIPLEEWVSLFVKGGADVE